MSIRGLLLDADGTLWDTASAMIGAGEVAAGSLWPDAGVERVRAFALRWRADPAGYFRRYVAGELTFVAMREGRFAEAAAALGMPSGPDLAQAFVAWYAPAFHELLRAYPDAVRLLDRAAALGVPVRVLTNSSSTYTAEKIQMVGLPQLTGLVCSRDCLGVGKPEPAVYLHACERLGVEPQDVLFVGDELEPDAIGPRGAGLDSLWLVRAERDPSLDVAPTDEKVQRARAHGIPVISSLDAVLA